MPPRPGGLLSFFAVILCLAFTLTVDSSAQQPETFPIARTPGEELTVFLMTVGPGDAIWEKFGHNAIWIMDRSRGTDVAYNYGLFAFGEGFYARLVRGNMLYSMAGFDGLASVQEYAASNRTVWVQELNLTPAQRSALQNYLEENALPENRDYAYDYFDDNCSTRVRDALDAALGGQLRVQLEAVQTESTYRSQGMRLLFEAPAGAAGLLLSFGPSTDQPLSAWEESFIPMRLRAWVGSATVTREDGSVEPLVLSERTLFDADRPAAPEAPPNFLPFFLAFGVIIGSAIAVLGRAAVSGGIAARFGFAVVALVWTTVSGIFGTIITALWLFTNHTWTYWNENVLQANPLLLILAPLVVLAVFGRAKRITAGIATAAATFAMIGLLIQVFPLFDQYNGAIIALTAPANCGLAIGCRWLKG